MNTFGKIIILLGVLIGVMRPFMPQRHGFSIEGTYEALSHIIIGLLIAGGIFSQNKKPFWIVLVIITAIEFFCAIRK